MAAVEKFSRSTKCPSAVSVLWQLLGKPRGGDRTGFGGVLRFLVVQQHATPAGFARSHQGRGLRTSMPSVC